MRTSSCYFTVCFSLLTEPDRERHRDRVALVVSVEGEDELAINWRDLNMLYTPRYVRYKGRDISSETKQHLLRRPVGWTP